VIWCPPSLFGDNVWSCSGGLPPREYLGQPLAVWFRDLHRKHLPVERRHSKISVDTHAAGGKAEICPPHRDLRCLFDPDWPDLPPQVVSSGAERDGR